MLQVADHRITPLLAHLAELLVAGIHGFHLDGNIVLELRSVGDVQIHGQQRIPLIHEGEHRLHFRRVGLHVIAVQVVVLRGGAPAHFHGAALVGTVPCAEAFMAIHVEHRHEHPDQFVQGPFCSLAFQYFTQCQEACILAIDFTGMDAALDQHDG